MNPGNDPSGLRDVDTALDHVLLGAPDLDEAIAWFDNVTGVRPAIGGAHPGLGTRNALVSLGPRQYLEIIAPDPAQSAFAFHIALRSLPAPRLVTWAASTADADALARQGREAGLTVAGPRDGSRSRVDGTVLRWRTVTVVTDLGTPAADPVPFFIEWPAGVRHPAGDSPKGCALTSLHLEHPAPDRVRQTLAVLGIAATVEPSSRVGMRARLLTPKGELVLE